MSNAGLIPLAQCGKTKKYVSHYVRMFSSKFSSVPWELLETFISSFCLPERAADLVLSLYFYPEFK